MLQDSFSGRDTWATAKCMYNCTYINCKRFTVVKLQCTWVNVPMITIVHCMMFKVFCRSVNYKQKRSRFKHILCFLTDFLAQSITFKKLHL
jgi:hypothetical protein